MAFRPHPAKSMTLVQTPRAELCLEFANTLCWRGSTPASEALHSLNDLLAWCATAGVQDGPAIERFGRWWRAHPRLAAPAFAEAIELREAIYRLFRAAARSGGPEPGDLERLDCALAAAPSRIRLQRRGDGYAWQIQPPPPSVAGLLAPILWSAGDLLTGPHLRRVRQCANDKCLWLFLDLSKTGNRRWCSMRMCGNRAKAHRHYLKNKQD
jgi:predicted RNA-binding Zn ribbon-like protein